MQPNNLTALDFEDIKASIKSYLRTRNEFTDYDFDGSSLAYLIDTLAYNSYYSAFNANNRKICLKFLGFRDLKYPQV